MIPALPPGVTLPTPAQLKRRLQKSGYTPAGRSGGGGWLSVHALGEVQGYAALRIELQRLAAKLPPNLLEIVRGERLGTPTLSRASKLEVVAGLLAPTWLEIVWRDGPTSRRTTCDACWGAATFDPTTGQCSFCDGRGNARATE